MALSSEEIARLSAIVPPPVGTVSVDGEWIMVRPGPEWAKPSAHGGMVVSAISFHRDPDPLCPAWQGAIAAWLLRNATSFEMSQGACFAFLPETQSGYLYVQEPGAEGLCRLVLAVAKKEGEP